MLPARFTCGVDEPPSAKSALSPATNATAAPLRCQIAKAVSHGFVVPFPIHPTSRGRPVEATTTLKVCVHDAPVESVTVKSNFARPAFAFGTKCASALPVPESVTVPPTTFAVANVGAAVKPLVE